MVAAISPHCEFLFESAPSPARTLAGCRTSNYVLAGKEECPPGPFPFRWHTLAVRGLRSDDVEWLVQADGDGLVPNDAFFAEVGARGHCRNPSTTVGSVPSANPRVVVRRRSFPGEPGSSPTPPFSAHSRSPTTS